MSTEVTAKKRSWREAKMPQWARESIEADLRAGALSWPTEKKPEPVPFWWGEYEKRHGVVETGRYWTAHHSPYDNDVRVECHEIERFDASVVENSRSVWGREFMFRSVDAARGIASPWGTRAPRGLLFATERDAHLYGLWLMCEYAANHLAKQKAVVAGCG